MKGFSNNCEKVLTIETLLVIIVKSDEKESNFMKVLTENLRMVRVDERKRSENGLGAMMLKHGKWFRHIGSAR